MNTFIAVSLVLLAMAVAIALTLRASRNTSPSFRQLKEQRVRASSHQRQEIEDLL